MPVKILYRESAVSTHPASFPSNPKNTPLTNLEIDANFKSIEDSITAIESGGTGGGSIPIATSSASSDHFLAFVSSSSGDHATTYVNTNLKYKPSTGTLTATTFNSSSDERLKENVRTIEDSVDKVTRLEGVTFDWKDSGISSMGVIAQNVQQVFPELVEEHQETTLLSVNYDGLIGVLIEAVKELKQEIELLKKQQQN